MNLHRRDRKNQAVVASSLCESLEARLLLAADVTGSFASLAGVTVKPADTTNVAVDLVNIGDEVTSKVKSTLDVFAFTGDEFDPETATHLQTVKANSTLPTALDVKWNVPINLPAGTYRLAGVVDAAVPEDDIANNTFVSDEFDVASPDWDLIVGFGDKQKYPTAVVTGTTVKSSVALVVTNDSATAVPKGAKVNVVVVARPIDAVDDSQDVVLNAKDAFASVAGLKPGASKKVNVNVLLPDTLDGQYNLVAKVDTANDLTEADETNNEAVGDVLTAADAFVDVSPTISDKSKIPTALVSGDGTRITLTVELANFGNVPTDKTALVDINVSAVPAGGGDPIVISTFEGVKVGGIKPGAVKKLSLKPLFPPGVATDDYTLRVDVDTNDDIVEGGDNGETNNSADDANVIGVTIGTVDLVTSLKSTKLPPATISGEGDSKATTSLIITNDGNVPTPKGQTATVFVMLHPTGGGDDIPLGEATAKISGVKPGKASNVTVKTPIAGDVPDGEYEVIVNVVPDQPLDETDPDNTLNIGALDVAPANIDLNVTSATTTFGGSATALDKAKGNVTFENLGNVRADGTVNVEFFFTETGALDGGEVLLGSKEGVKVKLDPGKSLSVTNVDLILPDVIEATTGSIVAKITPSGFVDNDAANNVSTIGQITIAALPPFVGNLFGTISFVQQTQLIPFDQPPLGKISQTEFGNMTTTTGFDVGFDYAVFFIGPQVDKPSLQFQPGTNDQGNQFQTITQLLLDFDKVSDRPETLTGHTLQIVRDRQPGVKGTVRIITTIDLTNIDQEAFFILN